MHVRVAARVGPDERLVRAVYLVGEHVEQHLRVALRAQVPREEGLGALQGPPQLLRVGEVAVVYQVDAERRVDEEGLRLGGRGRAGGRVAHVAEPHGALEGVDGLLVAEDVGDEAVGLVLVELGAVDLEGKSWFFFSRRKKLSEFFFFFFSNARRKRKKVKQKAKDVFSHRDHARRVLPSVLQHQQALVELDAGRAGGLVDADDAALAGDGPAAG